MTIADQINRLNNAKAAIKQSLENKGVTVSDNALLDEYPALIDSIPMEGGDPYYEDLYNLRTSNGTSMAGLFSYCKAPELDLSNLDVSKVTDMQYMFNSCSSSVNIDGWDTNNVTDMSYMFNFFTGSIDISKLDTSNVINTYYMFYYANTDNIILTGLSFPKCTSLDNMFYSATGTELDLSSWDISNITNMYNIFSNAKYTRIDLTGWNTSKVTDMSNMFGTYDSPLEKLIIPDWDMTNVTSSSSFFGYSADYIKNLSFVDLSRSNDATITKIASYLPTKTTTTYGDVLVPENTSQAAYDALVAKYWRPLGTALSPVPTSIEIVAELDEIYPSKSTKVYLGTCEPWYADPSNVELVLASDNSIATMDENNIITSTGELGDIVLEARIKDTQEVVGTKTIAVSETDSYPNVVKFRIAKKPESYYTVIDINNSAKSLSDLTYDSLTDIYSYDNGAPITSILFNSNGNINELIKLDTSSITRMNNMFNYCQSLTSLDVSNWDTSYITDMSGMFYYCEELTELDVSNWDTSQVINMGSMFLGCQKLISLGDINNWDTNNVESMDRMFCYCYLLTELDLSNWVTNNVRETSSMFSGCTSLTSLNISNFEISQVNYGDLANYMFSGCNSLKELRLDNCSYDTIRKIITSYGFPTDAIEGVTRTIYCKEENAAGLTPPKNWVFSFIAVEEEPETPELPVDPPVEDIPLYVVGEFKGNTEITEVRTMVNESHDDLGTMFHGCTNLVSVNTQDWDTSNVTDMCFMFYNCNSLTELDVSSFNTSNVTRTSYMFQNCSKLTSLDLSNFDTSKVTDMDTMFNSCQSLTSIDLSNFDTSNVTDMRDMFSNCKSLTSLDLSNFDTNKVAKINNMFAYCRSLRELDLRNFDVSNVITDYDNMYFSEIFCDCSKLHTLRLDNCSNYTINKLIASYGFPTDAIEGVTRTIYCKEENIGDLVAPTNWVFSYVTEEEPEVPVDPPAENIPLYVPEEFQNNTEITEVRTMVDESHDSLGTMFFGCENLVSVNTQDWDTSNVTDMAMMFQGCSSLIELDLSNFNTVFVNNMSMMFYDCTSLTTLDLSNWDTRNISADWNVDSMFYGCDSLHTLRLDNCSKDTISDIIGWYTSFPTGGIGVTRTIYCKEANVAGLTAPNGWVFSYVD